MQKKHLQKISCIINFIIFFNFNKLSSQITTLPKESKFCLLLKIRNSKEIFHFILVSNSEEEMVNLQTICSRRGRMKDGRTREEVCYS